MNYFLHLLVVVTISLPGILGYNLIFGRGKILHFGPIGVGIATAYATFLTLRFTGSYATALIACLCMNMAISLLFAWLALRLESDAFGILTIAMHLAFLAIVLNWADVTRGALGIPHIPRILGLDTTIAFAGMSTVMGFGYAALLWCIDRSTLGRALGALGENRFHAESLGISRGWTTLSAFLIGGIGIFLTSTMYPQYVHLLHPNDYAFRFLIVWLMCIVAGGPGRVIGVTISTIVLLLVQEGLRFVPMPLGLLGPLRLTLFGVILILAVYIRRKELFPQPRTV